MNNFLKNWRQFLPHIVAIVLFILVSVIYFHPMLTGKRLEQHDITMWKGMSKEISDFREKTGEEALWTNSMFGGMPAWQISVIYSGNLIRHIKNFIIKLLPYPIGVVFLYFIGFYILLQVLRIDPWLSIAGALAFGFSSYFFIILAAGHTSKAYAISFMAPVLAGIILSYRGKYISGGLLTAIALALELEANHLQITYYLLLLVVILGIVQFVDSILKKTMPHFLKASGVLLLAALLAVMTQGTNLYASWEYSKETMRGKPILSANTHDQTGGLDKSYITNWSYGISETWSLMIPNAKGGATAMIGANHPALEHADRNYRQIISQQNAYWGDQPGTSGPVYAGAIIVFLFFIGLFFTKGNYKWILLAATILSILLSWGKNFMPFTDFFLDYIPGYAKFRAVSMTLVLAELCIPLLGFLGLYTVLKEPELLKSKAKWFYTALGLSAGISLMFYLLPTSFFNFLSSFEIQQFDSLRQSNPGDSSQINLIIHELEKVRIAIFKKDALRSVFFIVAAAALLILYAKNRLKQAYLIGILTVLIVIDMAGINQRYLNSDNFVSKRKLEQPFTETVANKEIAKDKDADYRVLDLTASTFNDTGASYFHHSIGGYHGAKLQRYQDLIDYHIQDEIGMFAQRMQQSSSIAALEEALEQNQVLNMLNTRYIIYHPEQAPIYNPFAFGPAWPVQEIQSVSNADEEINRLYDTELRTTAVINKEFASLLPSGNTRFNTEGKVDLVSYAPNNLVYEADFKGESLVVFSQIWYTAGWKAYVNGIEQPLIRANYALRALHLPAGRNDIVMKFEPKVWKVGQPISLISSALLLLFAAGWIFISLRPQKEQKP